MCSGNSLYVSSDFLHVIDVTLSNFEGACGAGEILVFCIFQCMETSDRVYSRGIRRSKISIKSIFQIFKLN